MGRLAGKVALITGGASGMGLIAAQLFASEGAKVVLTDVADDAGEQVAERIRTDGGEATYVHADVSREADAEAMVARAVDSYGGLTVLYNNAGVMLGDDGSVHSTDESIWDTTLAVNVKGVATLPAGLYVDLFAEAFYDLDYRHEGGALSKWLTLNYLDGTIIDVHLDDIGNDEPSAEVGLRQMAKGSPGNGGRIFPEKLNVRTTPRLAAAKRSAIEAMEEFNVNFMLLSMQAVLFVITMPLAIRGTRPQALRRPVVRGPPKVPVAGAAAGAANAVEATVQAAIKPNVLRHIFDKAAHKLAPLVKALGSEEAVVRQTAAALHKTVLPTAGQYEVQVLVAGTAVTVRGAVVNGIVRISTMFVP